MSELHDEKLSPQSPGSKPGLPLPHLFMLRMRNQHGEITVAGAGAGLLLVLALMAIGGLAVL